MLDVVLRHSQWTTVRRPRRRAPRGMIGAMLLVGLVIVMAASQAAVLVIMGALRIG